jgi:hypothetical protein
MAHGETIYSYFGLLPDGAGERLLLTEGEAGWSLPGFTGDERRFWQETEHVNRGMHDAYGAEVTCLRCVQTFREPESGGVVRLYSLDNHSPGWTPLPGARWVGESEWRGLPLAQGRQAAYIEGWFRERSSPPHPLRVPWGERGWFQEASAWIRARLSEYGVSLTGPIAQVRAWERSCVLRVPTDGGDQYFKALPRMFAFELPLVEWLRSRHPASFPVYLITDPRRRWAIMPRFEGPLLSEVPDLSIWEAALRRYSEIQIDLAGHGERLVQLGVPSMRLDETEQWIGGLLADDHVLSVAAGTLTREDIEELRRHAPALKSVCRELESLRIPASLEHGDFWPQNIVHGMGDFIYFDWSDCSLAHPFFSMLFYQSGDAVLPNAPDAGTRLRDAYLEPWGSVASRDRLLHAYALAQTLAPLHAALVYSRNILPNMEHRWEMENMPPHFLKGLLARLEGNSRAH